MPAIPTTDIAEEARTILESLSLTSNSSHTSKTTNEGREIRVLVTGFGPWDTHGVNPSSEIVRVLPDSLILDRAPPRSNDTDQKVLNTTNSTSSKVHITLHRLPDIPVSYRHVKELLPALLNTIRPDLILHMGLKPMANAFEVELGAPFGQYTIPDVTGFSHGPIVPRNGVGKQYTVGGLKMVQTGLDHPGIVKLWQRATTSLTPMDGYTRKSVKGTDSIGDFLCAFIYLHSLLLDPKSRALFLHVPQCPTAQEVDDGREVTECLIKAVVQSYLAGEEEESRSREGQEI